MSAAKNRSKECEQQQQENAIGCPISANTSTAHIIQIQTEHSNTHKVTCFALVYREDAYNCFVFVFSFSLTYQLKDLTIL